MSIPRSNTDQQQIGSRLSESEWHDLSGLIHKTVGIKLSETKRTLLVSRLLKRLKATGLSSFRDYFRLVTRGGASSTEHQQLINAITTNKTDFFREREHFEFFARWLDAASPEMERAKTQGFRIWCAATSTGEEPYTIAAVLREHLTKVEWQRAKIHASDIDTAVLETARRGVYGAETVECVDGDWRRKMFTQGNAAHRHEYRVNRDLREHVSLFQHNLIQNQWALEGEFDAIFCRNVLIYFDRATQEQVVRRLLGKLARHGLLFLGHAESINDPAMAVQPVAHAVYSHKSESESEVPEPIRPAVTRFHIGSRQARHSLAEGTRKLRSGQVATGVQETLEVDAHRGALLLLYDRELRSNAVAHCQFNDGAMSSARLQHFAAELAETVRKHVGCNASLAAKVIILDSESATHAVELRALVARFAEANIELVAVRHLDPPRRLLVDASLGRIRLERVACLAHMNLHTHGDNTQ